MIDIILYIVAEYEDIIELDKQKHEQVPASEEHDQHEQVPESEEHHQNSNEHSKGVINESENHNDDSKTIEPYEQQQNKQYKNENQGT